MEIDNECNKCHSENTELFIFEGYDYPVSKYTCLRCLDCKAERVLMIEPLYEDETEEE